MSDIDPEVVRLIRELLIQTDKLGFGHQKRARDIARQLDLAGKVIIDKGSVDADPLAEYLRDGELLASLQDRAVVPDLCDVANLEVGHLAPSLGAVHCFQGMKPKALQWASQRRRSSTRRLMAAP